MNITVNAIIILLLIRAMNNAFWNSLGFIFPVYILREISFFTK
jgi:hypothetical protein